mgnify:CR=1 FL=1
MSVSIYAHQPDLSYSLLSKTENGKYVLQISSSLSAFEEEIIYNYSKDAYKTPKEFKELVKKYFDKNVFLIVNEKDTLKFSNPLVLLGHETKFVVEVENIPDNIKSVYYKNTMFKDMHNNQMSVIMLVDGFPNKEYVLKNGNNQTILLEFENNQWKNRDLQSLSDKVINTLKEKKMILIGSLVLLLLFISWIYFRKKIRIKNEKL